MSEDMAHYIPGDEGLCVQLKFTHAHGQVVIDLSKPAAEHMAQQLVEAGLGCSPPYEIELKYPGRVIGTPRLDLVQAQRALSQTLGLIERAGFTVHVGRDTELSVKDPTAAFRRKEQ